MLGGSRPGRARSPARRPSPADPCPAERRATNSDDPRLPASSPSRRRMLCERALMVTASSSTHIWAAGRANTCAVGRTVCWLELTGFERARERLRSEGRSRPPAVILPATGAVEALARQTPLVEPRGAAPWQQTKDCSRVFRMHRISAVRLSGMPRIARSTDRMSTQAVIVEVLRVRPPLPEPQQEAT